MRLKRSFIILLSVISICSYSIEHKKTEDKEILNFAQTKSVVDSEVLKKIPATMQQFVDEKKISGAVTLVAYKGEIISCDAVGLQDIEKNIKMQKNTVFRIASMTKPFTAAAIMMLMEEGKLQLDDPVEKYLPEYKDLWLIDWQEEDGKKIIRPERKVTIRELLMHTDGIALLPKNVRVNSIAEYVLVVSQQPLLFEPGSKWLYGGSGITTAARIVEVVSGIPFDEFLKKKVFGPLKMEDTSFSYEERFSGRIAAIYKPSEDSIHLVPIDSPDWHRFPRPEGGLFSTAFDMNKWMQAILNRGIYKGVRILSAASVDEMTRLQTGELKTGFTEGMGFGLGFGFVREPQGVTSMLSRGTFGHGGAFGTQYWADPQKGMLYILMIQRRGFGNGDNSDVRKAFQEIAAKAITK